MELDEDLVNLAFNTIGNIKKPESLKLNEQQKVLDLIPSSLTGCSCTVAFIENDDIYLASTGSSQAFLSKEQKNNWEVANLFAKHDIRNPDEVAFLRAAHPRENVLVDGRILGIYKETRCKFKKKFFFHNIMKQLYHCNLIIIIINILLI